MYSRDSGFSLLELLVVLLIIGLSLGAVGFAIGHDQQARTQARALEQLAAEIKLEVQQSRFDGRDRGLVFRAVSLDVWSWQWWRQIDGVWQIADSVSETNAPGTTQLLTAPNMFQLQVDGKFLDLATRPNRAHANHSRSPDIVIYSSGEVTPFSLAMVLDESNSQSLLLCGDAFGRISLVQDKYPQCVQQAP